MRWIWRPEPEHRLTDAEARDLARRIARAVFEPTDADDATVLLAETRRAPADEARIERALVELGLVAPNLLEE